jgi:SAM-dependent methyltransferase
MSEAFYSHARLYDLMFPGGGPAVDFYRADANRQGGRVLELGCGTGHKLIPIASDGHPCVGLDFSSDMLAEAQRKANRTRIYETGSYASLIRRSPCGQA